MDDGDDCFQDVWNDILLEKENIGDVCNGYEKNELEKDRLLNLFCFIDEWLIFDDSERIKFFKSICVVFELFIKYSYLVISYYDKVIQFILDELWNLFSVS